MAGHESITEADTTAPPYDIAVVGGGMVGSLFAAALATTLSKAHTPLRLAVLEAAAPAPFPPGEDPAHDLRVSALSIASERMLDAVGAWQRILARRACPYREMLVRDGEAGGRTHFHASDIGASHLGHIVENRVIQLSLLEALGDLDAVDLLCPARLDTLSETADGTTLSLDDGRTLQARLVVGADGGRSRVRELAGIDTIGASYNQHALVATVATRAGQQAITWQRFVPSGPEALLPLTGARASLVWYNTPDEVARLLALDDDAFRVELLERFPAELGGVDAILERGSFPISRAHAKRYFSGRSVLIGDAAHTVHPLAGQGVNLGMLDAGALADVIADALARGHDIAGERTLRRYERWRRSENELMIRVLDGFHHAFRTQPEPLRRIRSALLDLGDVLTPVKHRMMRHAMGVSGDLPRLAR